MAGPRCLFDSDCGVVLLTCSRGIDTNGSINILQVLLAHVLLGERLTRLQLAGVGVALAGVGALSVG